MNRRDFLRASAALPVAPISWTITVEAKGDLDLKRNWKDYREAHFLMRRPHNIEGYLDRSKFLKDAVATAKSKFASEGLALVGTRIVYGYYEEQNYSWIRVSGWTKTAPTAGMCRNVNGMIPCMVIVNSEVRVVVHKEV